MKTMLLAVSGMSPAIVTETLYGMDKRGEAWPATIKVITTAIGAEKIWQGLVNEAQLQRLCLMLDKPPICFTRDDLLVVPGANGEPVVDARSEADHEALANFITRQVRDLTQDEHTAIHASIAGGRKTMTFYLGYAMTLFGRHFDRLSHVLVNAPFEGLPGFFFPTRESQLLPTRDGSTVDSQDAQVTLADIPFIRQRQLVPEMLTELKKEIDFRQLVNLINLGEDRSQVRLHIQPAQQQLQLSAPAYEQIQVNVQVANPWVWAFYLLLLEDSIKPADGGRGEFTRPSKRKPDSTLALMMAMRLAEIKGLTLQGNNFESLIDALIACDDLLDNHPNMGRTLKAVRDKGGVTDSQFDSCIQQLQSTLQQALPKNLADLLLPTQLYNPDGTRLDAIGRSRNKGGGYGVALPKPQQQITID